MSETNLDDINDRNLAAALWATVQEEDFVNFDGLGESHRVFWIEQAQQFRALLATITRAATVLQFPRPTKGEAP